MWKVFLTRITHMIRVGVIVLMHEAIKSKQNIQWRFTNLFVTLVRWLGGNEWLMVVTSNLAKSDTNKTILLVSIVSNVYLNCIILQVYIFRAWWADKVEILQTNSRRGNFNFTTVSLETRNGFLDVWWHRNSVIVPCECSFFNN